MDKAEILFWSKKYDTDHPWWVQEEKRLGDKFRRIKTLTKDDLVQVVKWKFNKLPGRLKRVSKLVAKNDDEIIEHTCRQVFRFNSDLYRIRSLDNLHGVGPALASTILTFYDPKNYGVHDIHVWREFFGKEPSTLFIGSRCYLRLLAELRKLANRYDLEARTVEKAHFKRNLDNS